MIKKKEKKEKKEKKLKVKGCKCKVACTECKCKGEVKRGRGRPKKIKTNEPIKFKKVEKVEKTEKVDKIKRGRGRPKKIREKIEEEILVPTVTSKFLGYCNKCKLLICEIDRIGNHVICAGCNSNLNIKDLLKEIEMDRPKTKKEYFQSINSSYTWHDYNPSSNINTIAKVEDPLLADIDDDHIKSDEDDIISKKILDD